MPERPVLQPDPPMKRISKANQTKTSKATPNCKSSWKLTVFGQTAGLLTAPAQNRFNAWCVQTCAAHAGMLFQ